MDARAHLLALGWAGPGYSLDFRPHKQQGHRGLAYDPKQVRTAGSGLIKPLLISQKHDRSGIGRKAHEPAAGREWWLKDFETALSNIAKSDSERTSGAATPEPPLRTEKASELYAYFVKGQSLQGTLKPSDRTKKNKRKSDVAGLDSEGDAGEGPMYSGQFETSAAAEFQQIREFMSIRDKDLPRKERPKKADSETEFAQIQDYLEARSGKKKKKRKSRQDLNTKEPDKRP